MANDLEVIVVSDGHDAKTAELFVNRSWRVPVKFLEIAKSQQGIARNRGLAEAKGEYVLFIGDDIFLKPDVCEKHLRAHAPTPRPSPKGRGDSPLSPACPERSRRVGGKGQGDRGRVAILGFITWDPSLEITPVMKWLEQSGWQFGYPKIQKYTHAFLPKNIQANFMYTSHISLPTAIAKQYPFREDLTLYGWEDVEWGMRLRDAGVRLFYEPEARGFHHHTFSLEESLKRMETLGRSLVRIGLVVPEFRKSFSGWKLFLYRITALFPTMQGRHARAFLRGLEL